MQFTRKIVRNLSLQFQICKFSRKASVKTKISNDDNQTFMRNIGILAHIDAGKTTTTERMLFFSGLITQMGEVHYGNTVTDFMEQERERGITITSASVSFQWKNHQINLLDTPGHIDFTMEVEQSLNVMDGIVVILDGSAGVEAQTVTVWRQANRHKIPRIIFINKMDRPKAELLRCEASIKQQLNMTPLILQLPLFDRDNNFNGFVDLINLIKYEWFNFPPNIHFSQEVLQPKDDLLWKKSIEARSRLIEALADWDDLIAEEIIKDEKKFETISNYLLKESIQKITLKQQVPVLCGSAYKNIGVQCLLDAIINYLPSPLCSESTQCIRKCFENNLCAKAFKIRHDEHKGPVTFFRIYSGHMRKGQKIYNLNNKKSDNCERLYMAHANDYEEIAESGAGNIVAVTGLKNITTGEVVTSSSTIFSSLKSTLTPSLMEKLNKILGAEVVIPDPVFFCSIEVPFQRQQPNLDKALIELKREDPSLKVSFNEQTGQTVLGGMGELHLEIIKDRIRKEYQIDVDLGPLQIGYREKIIDVAKDTFQVKHRMGNSYQTVKITLSTFKSNGEQKEKLYFDNSVDCIQNVSSIHPRFVSAIKIGVDNALAHGPKSFCPMIEVSVMLHWFEVGRETSESVVTSATTQCLKKLFTTGKTKLLEPIMKIEILCNPKDLESVLIDLNRKRAEITNTEIRGSDLIICGLVPLKELLGYAKDLRILTSGRGSFSMEFHCFKEMSSEGEREAIKSITGF